MLRQRFLQYLAVPLIIVQGANFRDTTKALEGTQILLVYVGEVRVCDDNVGQRLDVAQAMGYPG